MNHNITKPCLICNNLINVNVYPCVCEYDCSVNYNVQCMECISEQGKKGFFSPVLLHHYKTEKEAIDAWNNGEIDTKKKLNRYLDSNYMGD